MDIIYRYPGGTLYGEYDTVLKAAHTFIAGCTGSGKSTFLHGLLYSILATKAPCAAMLALIDLKQVELLQYAKLPHTLYHADTPETAVEVLKSIESEMQNRFTEMKKYGKKETDLPHIYVIIDEIAYLILRAGKQVTRILESLSMLGRAAHIHIVYACQNPRKSGPGAIPAGLLLNTDCRVALHCTDKLESRLIIQSPGAETLPAVGECYIRCGADLTRWKSRLIDAAEMRRVISHWSNPDRYIQEPEPEQEPEQETKPWYKRLFRRA